MFDRQKGSQSVVPVVQSFHESGYLLSRFWPTFYDQLSNDCVWHGKDSFKDTSLEMNRFSKKKAISFCKFYDNEGATQLLLRSDHFINPTG